MPLLPFRSQIPGTDTMALFRSFFFFSLLNWPEGVSPCDQADWWPPCSDRPHSVWSTALWLLGLWEHCQLVSFCFPVLCSLSKRGLHSLTCFRWDRELLSRLDVGCDLLVLPVWLRQSGSTWPELISAVLCHWNYPCDVIVPTHWHPSLLPPSQEFWCALPFSLWEPSGCERKNHESHSQALMASAFLNPHFCHSWARHNCWKVCQSFYPPTWILFFAAKLRFLCFCLSLFGKCWM